MSRNGVKVLVDLNMTIGMDLGISVLRQFKGRRRQRPERCAILAKSFGPRDAVVFHDAQVQLLEVFPKNRVQLGERVENLVPDLGKELALDHANGSLNRRLVPGSPGTRGQDCESHVIGVVHVNGIYVGIVEMRLMHAALEIINDEVVKYPAKEVVHAFLARDEFLTLLRQDEFPKDVITECTDGCKQMGLSNRPGQPVCEPDPVAVIDLALLAWLVMNPNAGLLLQVTVRSSPGATAAAAASGRARKADASITPFTVFFEMPSIWAILRLPIPRPNSSKT